MKKKIPLATLSLPMFVFSLALFVLFASTRIQCQRDAYCHEDCSVAEIFHFVDLLPHAQPLRDVGFRGQFNATCNDDARYWLGYASAYLHSFWPFEAMRGGFFLRLHFFLCACVCVRARRSFVDHSPSHSVFFARSFAKQHCL